jgi:uncharacterized protein YdhG (YjbR/CyaY superfamily)
MRILSKNKSTGYLGGPLSPPFYFILFFIVKMKIAPTVDAYIQNFPATTQMILREVRATIQKAAPMAEESISYGMPAYKINGKPVVYFAGYENHIGFYATPTGHIAFEKELLKFKQGKGSVQFPIHQKMPLPLIAKMVKFRVKEVLDKTSASKNKTA